LVFFGEHRGVVRLDRDELALVCEHGRRVARLGQQVGNRLLVPALLLLGGFVADLFHVGAVQSGDAREARVAAAGDLLARRRLGLDLARLRPLGIALQHGGHEHEQDQQAEQDDDPPLGIGHVHSGDEPRGLGAAPQLLSEVFAHGYSRPGGTVR